VKSEVQAKQNRSKATKKKARNRGLKYDGTPKKVGLQRNKNNQRIATVNALIPSKMYGLGGGLFT